MSWESILKSISPEAEIKQGVQKLEMNKIFDIKYVATDEISEWNSKTIEWKIVFDGSEYILADSESLDVIDWDLHIVIHNRQDIFLAIHGGDGLPEDWDSVGMNRHLPLIRDYNMQFKGDNAIKRLLKHLDNHLLDMYLELRSIFVKE
jgi:hypothetical protein